MTMTSASNVCDVEHELPPVICNNTREKILSEKISLTDLVEKKHRLHHHGRHDVSLAGSTGLVIPLPIPRYSLSVAWAPSTLCFNLDEDTVVKQLTVQNSSAHCIYIQCCGLWNSTAKLGASWKSYPRTRFLLAPGIMAVLAVKATPREYPSPLPSAHVALELAASYMRDNVVGYFVVPIQVRFNSYIPPPQYGE